MQFPVSIELQRSYLLVVLLVIAHAAAVACLIALPWPGPWRSGLVVVIAGSLAYALRPPRIIGLRLRGKGALEALLANGDRAALSLCADSTVFGRLIVLRVRVGEETRVSSLTVLPDQLSAEQFRLLRLWLRWRTESGKDATNAS